MKLEGIVVRLPMSRSEKGEAKMCILSPRGLGKIEPDASPVMEREVIHIALDAFRDLCVRDHGKDLLPDGLDGWSLEAVETDQADTEVLKADKNWPGPPYASFALRHESEAA